MRVDGRVYELEEIPKLNRKLKHDIEVVVDRFKVRDDIKQRLAESFETALRLSEGIAYVAPLATSAGAGGEQITFSSKMSCPHCGYSIEELEPRLFSFNAPHGACPKCDGLGQMRSEEHTSELQSLMRISYDVFCLKKKTYKQH